MTETVTQRPNWAAPVLERLAWLTDVFEGFDGSETRTPLRSLPRRTLEYQVFARGPAATRLDALLWGWQTQPVILPIWTDPQALAATLAAGASVITCTTAGYDFAAGASAVLTDGSSYETVTIDTVNASDIGLTGTVAATWPAGTLLYPARAARMQTEADLNRHTAGVVTGVLAFEITDPATVAAAPEAGTYRGVELVTRTPNWQTGIPLTYTRKATRHDYDLGVIDVDDHAGLPTTGRRLQNLMRGRAAIATWRGWLHARQGRYATYWQPSHQTDLVQSSAIAAASLSLRVRTVGYSDAYALATGRRDLALLHRDGTWYYRRIDSAVQSGDEDVLTLDSALGIDADPGDFVKICWLSLSRLEADAVEIAWHTAAVATSVVDVRSVTQ
jgi:hypothetical protein